MAGNLDTNSIFLIALALCFVVLSSLEQIYLIDNLILVQLSLGYIFGVMTLWGSRTRYYKKKDAEGVPHFGGWGTHSRLFLCLAASCYSLWFWTVAVMHPKPNCFLRERCGGMTLGLFGTQSAQGSVRYGNALFSAGCVLYYGVMMVVAIVSFIRHILSTGCRHHEEGWVPQEMEAGEKRQLSLFYLIVSLFNILWILFTMACVESTLVQKHVVGVLAQDGLASAGQLLPLAIGVFSLFRLGWVLYKEYHDKSEEESKAPKNWRTILSLNLAKRRGNIVRDLLTGWLPWLNCFASWSDRRGSVLHMAPAGRGSVSSYAGGTQADEEETKPSFGVTALEKEIS